MIGRVALPATPVAASPATGHLFHPVVDFLLVGGPSIFFFPLASVLFGGAGGEAVYTAGAVAAALATLVNYPHFAHSYQLLYGGLGKRISDREIPLAMRARYAWAGFVAPGLIVGFLAAALLRADARLLALSVHAMLFLVGWHYVKQGYGVLVTLSALRGIVFTEPEKKWLRLNAYAVWIHSWMALNEGLRSHDLYGVGWMTLDFPPPAILASGLFMTLTTALLGAVLFIRVAVRGQPLSFNGFVAYACALYLWVVARYVDPVYAFFVPAFHSLQYLAFVWRARWNRAVAESPARPWRGFSAFVFTGIALGWLGFSGVPGFLQEVIEMPEAIAVPALFVFLFNVAINVHHYVIDNVVWRREGHAARLLRSS